MAKVLRFGLSEKGGGAAIGCRKKSCVSPEGERNAASPTNAANPKPIRSRLCLWKIRPQQSVACFRADVDENAKQVL